MSGTAPGSGKSEPKIERPAQQTEKRNETLVKELEAVRGDLHDKAIRMRRREGADDKKNEFPAEYMPQDRERDTRFELKQDLLKNRGNYQATVPFGEKDLRYLQEKQKVQERIEFDNWFSQLFDTTDVNNARLAQQIYPDFYNAREEFIDRQAELQKRMAKIKLRGPRDLGDLQLIYLLQTGDIKLRDVPLWKLDESDGEKDRYNRGLFNPMKFMKKVSEGPKFTGRQMIPKIDVTGRGRPDIDTPQNWGQMWEKLKSPEPTP